jgi:CheY-like chemotaxis protein/anti-sigma regulatory factor (Ser/Thr protein kinase)
LDVARVTAGKIELRREVLDLRELVVQCVRTLANAGRTRQHHVAVEGESIAVHGDPARLAQVVDNLLDNALKYTAPGGHIRLSVSREHGDVMLRVLDTGEGIRAELRERVFERFVQEPQALDRARGGLGLGLALVKQLVDLHGGSVAVTSAGPGRGSEFIVRLPATRAPGGQDGAAASAAPTAGTGRRRVLIVEDNDDAREGLRMLLTHSGHEVETSEDAPSGLEKLRAFRPDVVLIDIGLPGVDGYALARMVREAPEAQATRLIALTGYGQDDDRRKALASGFDEHLTKPIDPTTLGRALA